MLLVCRHRLQNSFRPCFRRTSRCGAGTRPSARSRWRLTTPKTLSDSSRRSSSSTTMPTPTLTTTFAAPAAVLRPVRAHQLPVRRRRRQRQAAATTKGRLKSKNSRLVAVVTLWPRALTSFKGSYLLKGWNPGRMRPCRCGAHDVNWRRWRKL